MRLGAAYTLGAVLGGVASIGVISGVCAVLPPVLRVGVASAVTAYALAWHARGARTFGGSRSGRQANRRWAQQTRFGRFYFGAVLGFGVLTYMTTPLVYAGWLYAAAVGLPASLLAGVGFGLGRSRPIATGLAARGRMSPAGAADFFSGLTRHHRIMGCGLAVVILVSLATQSV